MSLAELSPDARALALIERMSLDDKIHLVHGHVPVRYEVPPLEHLGVPALKMTDGPSGVNAGGDGAQSTAFPSSLAVAATFDPDLAREQAGAIARELVTHGMNVLLAPNLDIVRHPWWGRATEQYGEDPHLAGRMGEGFVRGAQENGVAACAKHFVGYSQEVGRMHANDIRVDETTLREVFLAPFERVIMVAGVDTVMSSFSRINGIELAEHPLILQVLKGDWGFKGWIMSDYGSLGAGVPAALAGFDQEMPGVLQGDSGAIIELYSGETGKAVVFDAVLKRAVLDGKVSVARLNDMVHRILRTLIARGLFDRHAAPATFDVPSHRAIARKVAAHSLTLLKNSAGTLPFGPIGSLVLIGADADHRTATGGASVVVRSTASISPADGLRAACAERSIRFAFAPGSDRVGPASMLDSPEAIPSSCLQTEQRGGSPGLKAVYTSGGSGPVERVDAQVLLNVGFLSQLMNASALPPPPGNFGDYLQVRWTGWLSAPAAGDYRLALTCMGSARLLVEGHEVLRIDASASPTTAMSQPMTLLPDRALAIEVQYEATAHTNWLELGDVILGWEPPDSAIPPAVAEAVRLAADADAAVVFVHPYESEQRDRATLSLPNGQDRLVRAVAAANPRTIVVVSSGGPVLTPWLEEIAALIQVYHPGQEGGDVLAAALFGDINPSGRLPVTWPASETDVPVARPANDGSPTLIAERTAVGYRGYVATGTVPAFAFGHGLGYAEFAHSNLRVEGSPTTEQGINVVVDVENLGSCDGEDVLQIYQRMPSDRGNFHRLVGFRRIAVPAGARQTACIALTPRDLAFWSETLGRFLIPAGTTELSVGRSALDLTLHESIMIDTPIPI